MPRSALLDPAKSPFAFLIGRDPQEELGEEVTGIACVCRKESCTGDWPATFGDMEDGGDLPFKCLRIRRDGRIDGI